MLVVLIGSVSAADVDDTAISIQDISDEYLTSEVSSAGSISGLEELDSDNELSLNNGLNNIVSSNNDNEPYSEPGTGTFTDLQELINQANPNSVINLPCNYKYNSENDTSLKNGIVIDKMGLTINGNGCTIDGSNLARIFQITSEDVTLNNISFINGNISFNNKAYGGAIYWQSNNGMIANCSFANNSGSNGGAVYIVGNKTIVANSSFVENKGVVDRTGLTSNRGGAIYWEGANGTLSNSSFEKNTLIYTYPSSSSTFVHMKGGAVNWEGENGTVENCSFTKNSVIGQYGYNYHWYRHGDAVYWNGKNGKLVNSSFVENAGSQEDGGAIEWQGDNGIIANSSFINNTAEFEGGAIRCDGNNVTVANCSFVNNSGSHGGAIDWGDVYTKRGNNGVVINCTFVNNTAKTYYGGAVRWKGHNGTVLNSTFENNTASYMGGAIYWDGYSNKAHNGSVSNCIFVNNTASYGGAITWWSMAENGIIANCSILNNYASETGGGIYLQVEENIIVFNCSIMDNTALDGGAVSSYCYNFTLENCSISNNNASHGGALIINCGYCTVANCSFENNTATEDGGAIYSPNLPTEYFKPINTLIYNSYFMNNTASNGGAIYEEKGDVDIVKCSFMNNTVTVDGGAIYDACSNITISNSTFENNTAIGYGGAIYLLNAEILCELQQPGLQELAEYAIFTPSENPLVYNGTFVNNAAGNGGAIYYTGNASSFLEKKSSNEIFNILILYGATFNVTPSIYEGIISSSSFVNNSARDFKGDGGAIYWNGNGNVSNSSFVNNSARAGGAIYWNGNCSISDSYLIENKVLSTALYGTKENLLLYITFEGNENYINAIYALGTVDFNNVTYWNTSVVNSDSVVPLKAIQEKGINITLEIYNSNDELIINITTKTDDNGQIIYDYSQIDDACYYKAYHFDDTYYTYIETRGVFEDYSLSVNKSTNVSYVLVGDMISFTVNVTNVGVNPVDGVFVDEIIPDGLAYDSFSGPNWTKNGNKFIYTSSLGVGESVVLTIIFKATKTTLYLFFIIMSVYR